MGFRNLQKRLVNPIRNSTIQLIFLIVDQQRQAAKDQMRTLQEKQSLTLQHQQSQCQMLMKQLQSQMEAEMLMKSELVRNQMQILAQNGGDLSGDYSVLHNFIAPYLEIYSKNCSIKFLSKHSTVFHY